MKRKMMKSYRNNYSRVNAIVFGAALCFSTLTLVAGEDTKDLKGAKDIGVEVAAPSDKDWSVELGSGILFSNIRTGDGNNSTMVPIQLAGVLKIDDVSLDTFAAGIFRGNTEFLFRADFYQVTFGQENHLAGLSVGPRYNFVQPGWKVVPFVEGTVGVLFADSDSETYGDNQHRGLGQDFNFTFGVAAGVRYDITNDWYLRLSCEYVHISNAGLSEPEHSNEAVDALGPKLSVGYRF